MTTLGVVVESSEYRPLRSVIGSVSFTSAGNVVLRVGREIVSGGWEQTEYVVLSEDEAQALKDALDAAMRGEHV